MAIVIDGRELSQEECLKIVEKQAEDALAAGWRPTCPSMDDDPGDTDEVKKAKAYIRQNLDFACIYQQMRVENPSLRPGQVMQMVIEKHPGAHAEWLADVRAGRRSGKLEV